MSPLARARTENRVLYGQTSRADGVTAGGGVEELCAHQRTTGIHRYVHLSFQASVSRRCVLGVSSFLRL